MNAWEMFYIKGYLAGFGTTQVNNDAVKKGIPSRLLVVKEYSQHGRRVHVVTGGTTIKFLFRLFQTINSYQ